MTSSSRRLAALLQVIALLLPALGPSEAHAQGEGTGAIAPSVVALCKEALGHAKKGEFEQARVLYARALETSPSPAILFNLALAELNSDHGLDALRHFREYLRATDTEPAKVAIVRTDLLPKAVAATGHIRLLNAPAGSTAFLDGHEIVSFPGGIVDVVPGRHFISARTPDEGWAVEVTVAAGASADAVLHLVWVKGAPRGGSGGLEPSNAGTQVADAGVRR